MIYLQGVRDDPTTWTIKETNERISIYFMVMEFKSSKQARSWVLKELKRRSKEINRVKDRWLRDK